MALCFYEETAAHQLATKILLKNYWFLAHCAPVEGSGQYLAAAPDQQYGYLSQVGTVCPGSLDPFYIVVYYIE